MGELALNGQEQEQRVPRTKVLHGKEGEKTDPSQTAMKRCQPVIIPNRPKKPWATQKRQLKTRPQKHSKIHSHAHAQEE